MVLENQNVTEPHIFLEIDHAVAIGPQHVLDPLGRHVGQAFLVVGGFDDDFMGPDPIHAIIEAEALAVERAFDLKRGELIRYDTDGPVRVIGFHRLWPIGHNFFRRQSFLPRAKGAERCGQWSSGVHGNEVVRSSATFRRNNDPSTDNRITSEIRHLFLRRA